MPTLPCPFPFLNNYFPKFVKIMTGKTTVSSAYMKLIMPSDHQINPVIQICPFFSYIFVYALFTYLSVYLFAYSLSQGLNKVRLWLVDMSVKSVLPLPFLFLSFTSLAIYLLKKLGRFSWISQSRHCLCAAPWCSLSCYSFLSVLLSVSVRSRGLVRFYISSVGLSKW